MTCPAATAMPAADHTCSCKLEPAHDGAYHVCECGNWWATAPKQRTPWRNR